MSEELNYYLDPQGVLVYNNVQYPNHPETGHGWTAAKALAYVTEQEEQHKTVLSELAVAAEAEHNSKYIGHIVFQPVVVEQDTGVLLEALNPLSPFAETTVTIGSVLKLVANIQSDPEDPETVIASLPNDIFRVPLRNTVTGEVRLFAGLLDAGVVTIDAPMDTAGYWETTEALINSRIPEGYWFHMETKVFSVVYSSATVNAKVTG